jgi:hypothetical protein
MVNWGRLEVKQSLIDSPYSISRGKEKRATTSDRLTSVEVHVNHGEFSVEQINSIMRAILFIAETRSFWVSAQFISTDTTTEKDL